MASTSYYIRESERVLPSIRHTGLTGAHRSRITTLDDNYGKNLLK